MECYKSKNLFSPGERVVPSNINVTSSLHFILDGLHSKEDVLETVFKKHVCINSENKRSLFDLLTCKIISVSLTAYYDFGFDPDFCPKGNCFYKTQPSVRFFQLLIKMIRHVTNTLFLQKPEEKPFQELFRELVKIEKLWQKAAQAQGMLYPPSGLEYNDLGERKAVWIGKAPLIWELREHQFFQQLSKIANINKLENEKLENRYPSELLQAIHKFNRPQAPLARNKENILNGNVQNQDVARLNGIGFELLANNVDNHEQKYFIDQPSFLKAIDTPGDHLKHAVRELRIAIRQENYKVFKEKFHTFQLCWKEYITSHTLLEELSSVYSKEDFFAARYQAMEKLYQEMQNPAIYGDKNFLEVFSAKTGEIDKIEVDSGRLYERFVTEFPGSSTAKKVLEKQPIEELA